jgi:hypothetical protein
MYNLPHDVLEALKSTPEILISLLKGVTQERAVASKGGDEDWSVVQVVCHLRDAEEISLKRIRSMRDQDDPLILEYDQAALARERDYQSQNLSTALKDFVSFREQYVADLSALQPEEWNRTGRHNELGQITILSHVTHHACHDAIHCAQIARQLIGNV